jgi:hypothetical protein
MQHRRRLEDRLKHLKSLEGRLADDVKRLRDEAKFLLSAVRKATFRKAQQAETGSHISEWLRSPGLRAPT